MNKPNVVLKNLKTFKGHDGVGVSVEVYINGKKCFGVFDGAYGGELEIQYYNFDHILGKRTCR